MYEGFSMASGPGCSLSLFLRRAVVDVGLRARVLQNLCQTENIDFSNTWA
jgi:hypothetical protein